MNVIFLLQSLAVRGGIERTLTDKANYLASRGHQVTMVTYEQGQHRLAFSLDKRVCVEDLDCRFFTLYRFSIIKRLYKMWKMKRRFSFKWNAFVDKLNPDVVVMTTFADKFRKEIMSVSGRTKIVIESHTAFVHDYQSDNLFRKYYLKRDLYYIKKCDLLLTLTQGDTECWRKIVNNVVSVPNPVTFYCEEVNALNKETGRIISVGRLHSVKRFDRLIESFSLISSKYPSWHIDIFGGGNEKEELMMLIEKKGLKSKITIHDPTDDIYQEYQRSQFLVMSSDYEGFSLVIIEAMACGIPTVSTDCPFGPSEIISDGETGLLSKMDAQDLADKMEWMITHEQEREEMGRKAHLAAAKYKKEVVMKQWEKAYMSVVK